MAAGSAADILRQLETPATDRELLGRFARTRDQAAFAELVRRHGPVVLGVCRRVTGHADDAEDAFQAVFLVLARKAGSIGRPDLVGNWLYGVAVRVAQKARRSVVRRRAREVTVSAMPDPPDLRGAMSGSPELSPILDAELAALPAWYREAIVLCDVRGVSRQDAAAALRIPEGTLSSRLTNGRKKLAARLTRRGITLAAVGVPAALAGAKAAVPAELVTRTCGLVTDWAAGGAVPGPLARLANGGFAVRKTLMLGAVLGAFAAAGVVLAGRPGEDPPKPAVTARPDQNADSKPVTDAKPGDRPGFTTNPRRQLAVDSVLKNVSNVVWSPDGTMIAFQGLKPALGESRVNAFETWGNPLDPKTRWYQRLELTRRGTLVGFTPDSRYVITDLREYNLVSGKHQFALHDVKALATGFDPQKGPTTIELDSSETHGYYFAADGKTFRTVAYERDAAGTVAKLAVLEVDAATGKTLKSLLTVETGSATPFALSPHGKRLALIWGLDAKSQVLQLYDVESGAKTVYMFPAETREAAPFRRPGTGVPFSLVFSPDGKRLVVSRGIGRTTVLNTEAGVLPELEGTEVLLAVPAAHAFTGDGRLLVMTGRRYRKTTRKGGGGSFEQTSWDPAGEFLTVWDTQTGKALKTWDRGETVAAFNPARPLLAILEPNDDQTRLGLWDFSAEAAKK